VLVDSSPGLLGALAVAVRSAAEGQPPADPVRVSVLEGDGQVLIAVSLGGGTTAATHRSASLDPLYSSPEHPQLGLTLAVVRSLVARHGGELVLDGEDPTVEGLVVRLPVARRRD
jgi:C4-dicarboxylate-specific signal transduction histidine kinase